MDSNNNFEKRLDDFVNKYYRISIIKGVILFIILSSLIVLSVSGLEYFSWFNNSGRLFLLLFALISFIFIFYYFIGIPLLRYFGIFKRITAKSTEKILRTHLPEIKDYVLNVIELKELDKSKFDSDLLNASILQKVSYTSATDFLKVLSPSKFSPLFKYLFTITILYIVIFVFYPSLILDGSKRVINFQQEYSKAVGFTIILNDSNLVVEKGQDFNFSISVKGPVIPDFISYFIGGNEFLMTKIDHSSYISTIKSVNNDFSFRIGNSDFKTQLYNVKVLKPPFLEDFSVSITYPKYLNKANETLERVSNLKVPMGSSLAWKILSLNVDTVLFKYDNDCTLLLSYSNEVYFDTVFNRSSYYSVVGSNRFLTRDLIPKSYISVIPDLYPDIKISQMFDNSNKKIVHFQGFIVDDYGFSTLIFWVEDKKFNVPINKNINSQQFYFSYEFSSTQTSELTYYFEVFDNDELSGFKSTKSEQFLFQFPDFEKLEAYKKQQDEEVLAKMEKSLLLANEFKKDIESIKKKLFSENLSSFEKKQMLDELSAKQTMLEEMVKEFSKQNSDKNQQLNSFSEEDKELLKKQQEIQDMLDNVLTDELKALLEELQKMAQEFDNKELLKNLDKLDLNYKQLSEQLDKNLELLYKFEIERNLEIISKELKKISDDQKDLVSDTKTILNSDSILTENSNKLDKLQNSYKEALDKNEELENPLKLQELDDEFNDLENDIENSKNYENSDKSKSKPDFSKNSKKAKDLSEKIDAMLNNNRSNESGENADALRQVLENVLFFSFKQESINQEFATLSMNSPVYFVNIKNQQNLLENYSIIKDSLLALGKRTPNLGNHISKKVYQIETGLYDIQSLLTENNIGKVRLVQRYVLEYSNDLILLLSESLKNMENSGEGGGDSSKKKIKPKQSKPSMGEMRKNQEGMKSQLESMIKQMKEGKGKQGKSNSEQLAKMLAQQEIFQQMLNQMQNSSTLGKQFDKQLKEINSLLEQNKRDLIRRDANQQTLFRQNQIVTRLLEAESAEKERELDEERKSNEADNYIKNNPALLFEQDKKSTNFNEILNSNSLKLNYFYKNKYQEYIKNLN